MTSIQDVSKLSGMISYGNLSLTTLNHLKLNSLHNAWFLILVLQTTWLVQHNLYLKLLVLNLAWLDYLIAYIFL